jgi:hypothetical protein
MGIDHVPPEILIKIMSQCRDAQAVDKWNENCVPAVCCPMIYTCRYIYVIAIGAPELWTHVDVKWRDEWLKLCMSRAQSLPLNVDARAWEEGHQVSDLYEEALIRSSHAKVSLPYQSDMDRPDITSYMTEPLTRPMPHMRKFTLFANHDCVYSITPQFLGGRCTQLTSLTLSLVTIEGSTPEFPNLRILWLGSATIPRQAFISLLSKTPVLEHLQIDQLYYHQVETHGDAERPLHLPTLETVEIQHENAFLLPLLNTIPLPRRRLGILSFGQSAGDSSETGVALRSIAQSFWKAATGSSRLPPTILHVCCYMVHDEDLSEDEEPGHVGWLENILQLGDKIEWPWVEIVSRTFSEPSVFLSLKVNLESDKPSALTDVEHLDSIHILALEGYHIGLKFGTPLLDTLISRVSRLTIGDAYTHYSDQEVDQWPLETRRDLEDFTRRIQTRVVPLKTLDLVVCHPAMKTLGDDLRNSGHVEEIMWRDLAQSELEAMYTTQSRKSMMRTS